MNKFLLPLAALALSGTAAAAGTPITESVVVRYGDLNLNTQAGVVSLHRRIRHAAESVCHDLNSRILGLHDAYAGCVKEALTNGVTAVGNVNLINFHANRRRSSVVASSD
jgi:UrcA family protein